MLYYKGKNCRCHTSWGKDRIELKNVVAGLSGQVLPLIGENHHSVLKQGKDSMCGLV